MDLEPIKRYPILKLAEALNIKVKGRQAMCFNNHDSKTPSLNFNTNKNTWKCFGACGSYGDNIDLVQEVLELDFKQAVEWFEGLGVKVNKGGARSQHSTRALLKPPQELNHSTKCPKEEFQPDPEVYSWFLELCDPVFSEWATDYANRHVIREEVLQKKGVREVNNPASLVRELVLKWGKERLSRAGVLSTAKTRLIWPDKTLLFPFKSCGDIVYIQGRPMTGRAKFINLAGIRKPIYNEEVLAQVGRGGVVHICEGVPDALTMESYGHHAVAILGATAFDESYINAFMGTRVRVITDGDSAGEIFFESIKKMFQKKGMRVQRVSAPKSMDVGDVAFKEKNKI